MQNSNKIYKIISNILIVITLTFFVSCSTKTYASKVNECDTFYKNDLMLEDYLEKYQNKMKTKTGVYILENGIDAMLSRAWLAKHAQKTIDVQYFLFTIDNIGLIATNYLIHAAKRGIKVRVIVDDILLEAKEEDLLKLASHKNIEIKIYNPVANIGKNIFHKIKVLTTDFHKLNQRMHNKTFIVDGEVSITGGRNVADEYFGFDHEFNFRDRDVLLIGGVTKDVQKSFNEFWESDISVNVQDILKSNKKYNHKTIFSNLQNYSCDPKNFAPLVRKKIKELPQVIKELEKKDKFYWIENIKFVSDKPGKNNAKKFLDGGGISTDKLIELLKNSKKSVFIQTPYLITSKKTRRLLKQLVQKGVEVKITTNSLASNDNLEAFSGYQRDRKALLETGVEIYEFKPDAKIRQKIMSEVMEKQLDKMPVFGLHAKTMVIDEQISVIGTFNMDPRSANLNTENFVIINSKKIAKEINAGIIEEMSAENSWRITDKFNPDNTVDLKKRIKAKIRRIVPKSIL